MLTLTKRDLKSMLSIINKNSPRNYGSVLYVSDDKIVATDGFRLSYIEKEVPDDLKGTCIPYDLIKAATSVMEKGDLVCLEKSEKTLSLIMRCVKIEHRHISIKYPSYKAVLPEKFEHTVKLNKKEFAATVKQRIKNESSCSMKQIELPEFVGNEPCLVNGGFLLDALTTGENLTLSFNGPDDPVMIKSGDLKTVIVPIRRPT